MESNQVILDLEKYNELRDFKKMMEDENTINVHCGLYVSKTYITTDQALKDIAKINDDLRKTNEKLHSDNITLGFEKVKYLNEKVSLYNMSYWEFRKWRKSIKNK